MTCLGQNLKMFCIFALLEYRTTYINHIIINMIITYYFVSCIF